MWLVAAAAAAADAAAAEAAFAGEVGVLGHGAVEWIGGVGHDGFAVDVAVEEFDAAEFFGAAREEEWEEEEEFHGEVRGAGFATSHRVKSREVRVPVSVWMRASTCRALLAKRRPSCAPRTQMAVE